MPIKPTRTHVVANNVLHDGKLYLPGQRITFSPKDTDEAIAKLIEIGVLEGPRAQELAVQRELAEMQIGIRSMTPEEQLQLWRNFTRRSLPERLAAEKEEARQDVTVQMEAQVEDDGVPAGE